MSGEYTRYLRTVSAVTAEEVAVQLLRVQEETERAVTALQREIEELKSLIEDRD